MRERVREKEREKREKGEKKRERERERERERKRENDKTLKLEDWVLLSSAIALLFVFHSSESQLLCERCLAHRCRERLPPDLSVPSPEETEQEVIIFAGGFHPFIPL